MDGLGRALLAVSRLAGVVAAVLAAVRPGAAVDRHGAAPDGARRGAAARASPAPEEPQAIDPPPTKKAALLALYRVHPDYGVKASASKVAASWRRRPASQPGTARAYLYAELESRAS